MKFDPKKPHGTIYGHPWARYEQGGQLFDWNGNSPIGEVEPAVVVEELPSPVEPINNIHRDFAAENARAFLTNVLSGGPLQRSVVFKECESNNQDWMAIKNAFSDMDGKAFRRKGETYWQLKTE